MPYQIDFWGGELHQNHVAEYYAAEWSDAQQQMKEAVDAGLLCNVLHTDFICPPEKKEKQKSLLAKYLVSDAGKGEAE